MNLSHLVFPFLAATACLAQATHSVGPGGLADINAALAVAATGDVVLVAPGTYPSFQATVGVTIRAVQPGTVQVGPVPGSSVQCPGQTVHLVDLRLTFLNVSGSTCVCDGCVVTDAYGLSGPCMYAQNATVVLTSCDLIGANPAGFNFGYEAGLAAFGSRISAVDCTFRGRPIDLSAYSSHQPGIFLVGSTLHGARLNVQGSDGWTATSSHPGPALLADTGSSFWVADSDLRSGLALGLPGTPPTGCAVFGNLGRLARCTITPSSCAPSVPTTGELVGVRRLAPLQAGAPFQIDFHVEPNQFVGVFASLGLGTLVLPTFEQPIALDLASLINLGIVVADAAGQATGTWSLPPGTANLQLWLQGVTTTALPLQLGPVVGGVVR